MNEPKDWQRQRAEQNERKSDRRSALIAAAQSLGGGSSTADVIARAEDLLSWIADGYDPTKDNDY